MNDERNPPPRVLVVDDQPDNIAVLDEALGRRYTVQAASNGEEALRLIGRQAPDLILLDIMMPGLDGYEVCRRLKADPATRDIPVIFLTALATEGDEIRGLTLGAVDYVHKPIFVPLVQARVATHLELAAARRQLAAQVHALEAEARLREDVEQITRHDLKGPLTVVLGYTDLMLKQPDRSERDREMLTDMRAAGFQMLGMINRSLDLYKMETGRYHYQHKPCDLGAVVGRAAAELATLADELGVRIERTLPSLWIGLDELLALSMFANLVKNAIEASPAGGVVAVEAGEDAGWAVTRITNSGAVPAAVREHFFDKYATAGKWGGTGLGTYSARLMARTMGGDIRMETDEAWGTRLTVRLPLDPAPSE